MRSHVGGEIATLSWNFVMWLKREQVRQLSLITPCHNWEICFTLLDGRTSWYKTREIDDGRRESCYKNTLAFGASRKSRWWLNMQSLSSQKILLVSEILNGRHSENDLEKERERERDYFVLWLSVSDSRLRHLLPNLFPRSQNQSSAQSWLRWQNVQSNELLK